MKNQFMAQIEKKSFNLEIASDTRYLSKVERLSEQVAKHAQMDESDSDDLGIVTTELVNNAIHHGNKNDPTKKVFISFTVDENQLELRIKDQGNGFNPDALKDPLAPENLMNESGRGIFLIRALMDSLDFEFSDSGTETIVTKNLQ
jgi:serine/threonine-protein kinase RsbW